MSWTAEGCAKPGATRLSAANVRIMRPEQTSSTRATATCTITSTPRVRLPLAAVADGAAASCQRCRQPWARMFRCRDDADEQAGKEREDDRKQEDGSIDSDLVEAR